VNPLRSLSQSSSFSLCRFWMSALFCRFNGSYEAAYRSCAMRDQTLSYARHARTPIAGRERGSAYRRPIAAKGEKRRS
jgi:hypothetical protein